ncbi:AT-rich interactive domain-containing protein 3A [Acipenser ruthenus]|uniref:AT-rich interactive domain-containing protein 3 n=1 Tax=Acipenser ruthenus TaxID=7906 RepID=A0A444UZC1_ACIRT|nr:AT-rich interactive domain-containing protein 3A [Acipenser ruthenus]
MKYLYPYECEKRGLSSPGELQAAIDSNRREGRRQSYGSALFNYSPVGTPSILSSTKIQMPAITMATHNGSHMSHMSHMSTIKKEETILSSGMPSRIAIPVSLAGHHIAAAQAAAAQASAQAQAVALEQLREKLESGEPPEKKMMLMAEEQQRFMQHALQQNLLAMASQLPMNITINNRGRYEFRSYSAVAVACHRCIVCNPSWISQRERQHHLVHSGILSEMQKKPDP